MFSSTIESYKGIYDHEPRVGIYELLKLIDERMKTENPRFLIFFSAPTGYGKSSCTVAIANTLVEKPNPLGERLIHVLPLRSIVEDLYRKSRAKQEAGKLSTKLTLGAQAMHILDVEKSPYMLPRLIYTTIDSFIHNLFKRPVAELYKDHSHFDVPRYAIYSSFVVFDEAHLFSSEIETSEDRIWEKHNRMLTSFYAAIRALTEASVPVLVMTATMPDKYIKSISEHSPGNIDLYSIEVRPSSSKIFEEKLFCFRRIKKFIVKDQEFYRKAYENNPRFRGKLREEDIDKVILEQISSHENPKILVVRNTVNKALTTYTKLTHKVKGLVKILHGRMNVEDRENILKLISEAESINKGIILVTTQVIEAGVDIDFDMLISDATTFSSLVQRIGRIGRRIEKRKIQPSVYIVNGDGDGIYSKKLVETTLNNLEKIFQRKLNVGWRIPVEDEFFNGLVSYKWLLETIYKELEYRKDKDLFNALMDIDHYFVGLKSKELQLRLCSFVREEGLMAVSSWTDGDKKFKDTSEALKSAYKTIIPLNISFLTSKWKELLEVSERTIKILVCDSEWLRIKNSDELYEMFDQHYGQCKLLNMFDKAMNRLRNEDLIPIAVLLRAGIYEKGVGLKIG